MIQKVITGGQTGVEQAAWAAARRAGIATGGYMPRGFLTDEGPAPRLGALHGAIESPFDDARRGRANLRGANGLFWFGSTDSPEARDTFDACRELAKPFLTINPRATPIADAVTWLAVFGTAILVVTGDRAARAPGIGPLVKAYLDRTFVSLQRATSRIG